MAFRKNSYILTYIDFESDDFALQNSNQDEVMSQYSNSDLQEFNNFERDIYGGDDISSEDQLHSQPLPYDNNNSGDEVSDSLRLVLPKILVKPSLGDPIQTYDQLRGQYKHNFVMEPIPISSSHSEKSQAHTPEHKQNDYNPRISSRASGGSAETVLSQNDEIEQPPTKLVAPVSHSRNMRSSISSTESAVHNSTRKSHSKATQKILLDKERDIRKDQDKYISHLQHTINQLLTKHALAEETIDQLRLGVVINTQTRYKDQRPQRRNPSTVKKKPTSRRYSSIVDNANFQDYEDGPNVLSRAKSVDMSMFDEEPDNGDFNQKPLSNNFGGSMKLVDNNGSNETDIANDIRTIGDYFQSRIKILTEAAHNLQYNSSGRGSVSSGSHNSDITSPSKIVYDSQRHTPMAMRLKNLQTAYEDLQSDFNGFRQINKNNKSEYTRPKDGGLDDVEGDLFQLGMKIDDLERSIAEGRDTPTNNHLFESTNRDSELMNRFTNVEEQYQSMMDRYNSLKGSRVPAKLKQLDDIVQQLQTLVKQADGRYSNIPTPDKLESMMQRDIIDKIKQHMSSDSPPYFLTEEDGLSSGHSSFGKGHRRRKGYRVPRSDEDSDFRPPLGERLSPIKSRISTHIAEDNHDRRTTPKHVTKPSSLPVSVVSSSSMWHGATSGETLALDDQGIMRDSLSRKGNSSAGSDIFQFPNKSLEEILESRRHSKINNGYGSQLANSSPLHDDIKRLDEQLEKVELEEKRQISAARDSDAAGSRNTRSLLGTSPSNSIVSRHSKLQSSVASSQKSQTLGSDRRKYSNNEPKDERKKRRMRNRYSVPEIASETDDEDTPSEEYDLDNYVKSAGCGLGPRSRYVRSKNKNLQDRWSQTPPAFDRRHPDRRTYERDYAGAMEDPFIDDVAYWDGVAFHPSRENIPGKSILRRPSPNSKHRRNNTRPQSLYAPQTLDRNMGHKKTPPHHRPSMNGSLYPESSVAREYYKMDPYRYFVREYGQRSQPMYNGRQSMYDGDENDNHNDDDDDDDDEYEEEASVYNNYMEERRLRGYLDEAVRAAQSMKRYTKRISELCEQRQQEDSYTHTGSAAPRHYRDYYAQHS